MIVGEIFKAARSGEEPFLVAGRLVGLGLDADTDDGGRNALDHVGKSRHLRRLDTHRIGKNRNGSRGDRAEADGHAPATAMEATAARSRPRLFETELGELVMGYPLEQGCLRSAPSAKRDIRADLTAFFPANETLVMFEATAALAVYLSYAE